MSIRMEVGWFGEYWPSGVCDDETAKHFDIPVGDACTYCEEEIEEGAQGVMYHTGEAIHRECAFRMVAGSIAHLRGVCSCYVLGSTEEDPEGYTLRQGALVAFQYYQEHGIEVFNRQRPFRDVD